MLNSRNPDLLLGDKRIPLFNPEGERKALRSKGGMLWVCPYCAKPWAKLEGSENPKRFPFHIISWPCLEDTEPGYSDYPRGGSVLPALLYFPEKFNLPTKQSLLESISQLLINHEAFCRVTQILKETA